MPGWLHNLKAIGTKHGPLQGVRPWLLLLDRFLYSSASRTRSAPHVRDIVSVQGLLNRFVIASIPCWLIGLWSLGHQSNLAMSRMGMTALPGWRGSLLSAWGVGHDPGGIWACFFLGLVYFIPVFLVALSVASIWEVLFSAVRRRLPGEGLLVFAWLFSLALPAGVALYQVALGVTFGFVVGSAIYGGSGRYLVNPALLGLTFLLFAYPALVFGPDNWVPILASETAPALKIASIGGIQAVQAAGYTWWDLFLGVRPGPFGTLSVLGCLVGAIYLVLTDTVSWRILAGALLGMVGTILLFNSLAPEANPMAAIPWSWHLVLGGFAFGIVFFATDPVPAASTQAGRWMFGMLVGALTVVIRVSNPSYNEGVLFAVLLASLFAPVIDFFVVEMHIRRRRRRLAEAPREQ
jgi:Na+-transporting NADH:ubiquinone oxidoreductase subunit B